MLLTAIFLIATVNLAVGYALGAGLGPGALLAKLPAIGSLVARFARRPRSVDDELDSEASLTRPVAEAVTETPPAVEAAPASSPPEEVGVEIPATPDEMMASLANFREKLSAASVELKLSQEDPDQFDACATKLQNANHQYLEQAEGAAKTLADQDGAVAAATCEAVANGTEAVAELSGEIDGLIEGGLESAEARADLITKAKAIRDTAGQVEGATERAITKAEASAEATEGAASKEAQADSSKKPDAASEAPRVVTAESIDQLFESLGAALEAAEGDNATHLAAFEIDPLGEHEQDDMLRRAVERAVGRVLSETLDEGQCYHGGETPTALLVGDDFEQAVARVERVRQLIAAITFKTPNAEVHATVTCGLADARSGDPREHITEQLRQAIEESQSAGNNRSFHHDGAFPTPIEEQPFDAPAMTITVG